LHPEPQQRHPGLREGAIQKTIALSALRLPVVWELSSSSISHTAGCCHATWLKVPAQLCM